jgi:catechol 2,3-dioxygenase-like lactoylglutathione lyase family enzyme
VKVTACQHVSICTGPGGLGELVAFYRDVLGLETLARPDIPGLGGHWFALGDGQLHLVDDPRPASTRGIDPTGPHFCVEVADLDSAVAELDARGIEHLRGAQRRPGTGEEVVQLWIRDPAGNTVELQQDRSTR